MRNTRITVKKALFREKYTLRFDVDLDCMDAVDSVEASILQLLSQVKLFDFQAVEGEEGPVECTEEPVGKIGFACEPVDTYAEGYDDGEDPEEIFYEDEDAEEEYEDE